MFLKMFHNLSMKNFSLRNLLKLVDRFKDSVCFFLNNGRVFAFSYQ